jgi:phosphoribosyl-ATP pyrophosphohydrolase/phosphoribosyl-AMP cyclohydrolase/histidinol dehydrogenase
MWADNLQPSTFNLQLDGRVEGDAMSGFEWRRLTPEEVRRLDLEPVDRTTLDEAARIIDQVREGGEPALRRIAEGYGDTPAGESMVIERADLNRALLALPTEQYRLLERTAERIRAFAEAQLASIREIEAPVPGGRAGQSVSPMERAGCYAPGGRFPLPSSVLMTAVTARAAGVAEVWVASPRPTQITLAAAAVADADALLAVGGAQAIAALAYGIPPAPACDVIVGPGNRWVTAAKQLVSGRVGIDLLAGPSELTVLADDTVPAEVVAADLLAQAEHDPDAVPVLVTTSADLADRVEAELARQLADLPTRETAAAALGNGFAVVVDDPESAIELADRLAPEHLQLLGPSMEALAERARHYGGLFVGSSSAEVFGDYGAGPNHTLPTGGGARFTGGLSVLHFLRVRTWMRLDRPDAIADLARDAAALARLEGLEAHARAAEARIADDTSDQ